jgi:Tol biopolymer transport system component
MRSVLEAAVGENGTDMTHSRTRGRNFIWSGIAAFLLGALLIAPAAHAVVDETTLISRQSATDGGAGGETPSSVAAVSADGRYVAFQSGANNLSSVDNNRFVNVFLRDTQTNATTLVSRASGAAGNAAEGQSYDPSISADGRYVAFESKAPNLSGADNNFIFNIFVRDTQNNTTILVSRQSASDGGAGADVHALNPSISPDGRYVAFESNSYELSTADHDTFRDIFLRDIPASTTTLMSRATGAAGLGGDDNSFNPSVSTNGRVAFQSNANNLSTADDNFLTNVYVRDAVANTTTLVSRAGGAAGAKADGPSYRPSINANGRFVAFESQANNFSGADNNRVINIFRRDMDTGALTLITRTTGGAGASGASADPSISPDGRFVGFESLANNLSTADNDLHRNVYLRDVQGGATILVSRQSAADGGAGADGRSFAPSVSSDGRFVAFDSDALNLSAEDADVPPGGGGGTTEGVKDVFLRHVLAP